MHGEVNTGNLKEHIGSTIIMNMSWASLGFSFLGCFFSKKDKD